MTKKPIYQQVIDTLRGEIESKTPNEPIMSEREIASTYNISRMTVRKAVEHLVQEGYLYRIKNKGTFVADDSLRKGNKVYLPPKSTAYRTLYFNVKEAGDEIASKLNIDPSESLIVIIRLHLEKGIPQCIDEIYFIKKYLSTDELTTIEGLLSLDLYIEKQKLLQSFFPIIVPIKYVNLLKIEQGTPIIKVENVIRNQSGVATLFFVSYLNPNQVTVQINN